MSTYKTKYFKNELDPKYAFYDFLRSCELKSYSEKPLEKYMKYCDWEPSADDLIS